MPVRSLEEHVEGLLARSVAAPKFAGAQSTSAEASAVFDSIALNLLFKPRAALYFELLAKNGLRKTVQDELAAVAQLKKDIQDLANPSFKIEGAPTLTRARSALLQLEGLPRISPNSVTLKQYDSAIQEFLEKNLSKNVRKRGSSELSRPAAEAGEDLVESFAMLKERHGELLNRLYLLAVGVENFQRAPLAAMVGTATVTRARLDLEEILEHVRGNGSPTPARDFAIRLLGSRAAIHSIASPPSPFDDIFPGGELVASPPTPASTIGVRGPFDLGASPTVSITVNGQTSSSDFFVENAAVLVSDPISFPLTIPADHDLFLAADDDNARIPLTTATLDEEGKPVYADRVYESMSELVEVLDSSGVVRASQFMNDGTRLMLYAAGVEQITVLPLFQETTRAQIRLEDQEVITVDWLRTTSKTAHQRLGFSLGQTGTKLIDERLVVAALISLFPSIKASIRPAGIFVQTVSTEPGTMLTISAPTSLGISGTFRALSSEIVFNRNVQEVLQCGDVLDLAGNHYLVEKVVEDRVFLPESIETFSGTVFGTSALVQFHRELSARVKAFLKRWSSTSFSRNLTTLDRVIAPLSSSQSPAQRNAALAETKKLEDSLLSLLNLLSDPATMLPDGAAQEERKITDGILITLTERNFTRAADLLMKCDIQALLEMDEDRASYAGNFLRASSQLAKFETPQVSSSDTYSVGRE